ncbi:BTAD domain-containing putative transcriptional regulator, partial [Nonomuraea sp. NPDC055795]
MQTLVSKLRKVVGAAAVTQQPPGYRLTVPTGHIDAVRFESLVAAARTTPPRPLLKEAIGLWRGEPYEEFGDHEFARAERTRLGELHAEVVERLIGLRLDEGEGAGLIAELEELVRRLPFREGLWCHLMTALYRAGRQSDALATYDRVRIMLDRELGVRPGPELRGVHADVLAQESRLLHERSLRSREALMTDLLDRLQPPASGGGVVICPYKGLARFDTEDAEYFHGRDRLVAALVARLAAAPLVALVGASGSGKSSAVRAGLLPQLSAGVLPGSGRWRQLVITPGHDHAGPCDLLVVDQFEEVFTGSGDVVTLMDRIVSAVAGGTRVVLTLRADFYGELVRHPRLARLVADAHELVESMSVAELTSAIERPAQRAGLELEPGLSAAIVADVWDQPGALPLLSTALLDLWERRSGRLLTHAAYVASGGVPGAIERLAERAYLALDEPEREAARIIFLRLAEGGMGERFFRRRADRDEFDGLAAEVAAKMLERRLLIADHDTVEVAHEALLQEWPRLRGWLESDASGRVLRGHLTPAARVWADGGRDPGELYRGARLATALEWAADHESELTAKEREFLEVSAAVTQAETSARRRASRRLRLLAMGLALAVLAASGVAVWARWQYGRAERTRAAAEERTRQIEAQQLSVRAGDADDPAEALRLAVSAVKQHETDSTQHGLVTTLQKHQQVLGAERTKATAVARLGVDIGRGRLTLVSEQGLATTHDLSTFAPIGAPARVLDGPVERVSFDRSGSLALMFQPERNAWTLWDAAAGGAEVRPLRQAQAAVFAGERRIALVTDHHLRLWEENTAAPGPPLTGQVAGDAPVVDQSGTRIAVKLVDRSTQLLDGDGRRLRRLTRAMFPLALSPGGGLLLNRTEAGDGLELWDTGTGARVATMAQPVVSRAVWQADGRRFVTTGDDGQITAWEVAARQARPLLTVRLPEAVGAALLPDAVVAASRDGAIVKWALGPSGRFGHVLRAGAGEERGVLRMAWNPRSSTLVTHVFQSDIERFDLRSGRWTSAPPRRRDTPIRAMGMSADGWLAVGYWDGEVEFGARVIPTGLSEPLPAPAVDGRWLAVTDVAAAAPQAGRIQIHWLGPGRSGTTSLLGSAPVTTLLATEGGLLYAGLTNGTIEVWDVAAAE